MGGGGGGRDVLWSDYGNHETCHISNFNTKHNLKLLLNTNVSTAYHSPMIQQRSSLGIPKICDHCFVILGGVYRSRIETAICPFHFGCGISNSEDFPRHFKPCACLKSLLKCIINR